MASSSFGKFIKEIRLQQEITLRDHCLVSGFDPGNYSRIERGIYPPPQSRELLERYAHALGIVEGSDKWIEFFDYASASRGEIPEELRDEELLQKLPVLFRTLRGDKVPPEKLDELIELIRKGHRRRDH